MAICWAVNKNQHKVWWQHVIIVYQLNQTKPCGMIGHCIKTKESQNSTTDKDWSFLVFPDKLWWSDQRPTCSSEYQTQSYTLCYIHRANSEYMNYTLLSLIIMYKIRYMNIRLIAYEHFITFFNLYLNSDSYWFSKPEKNGPMQRLIKYLRKKIEVSKHHPHFILIKFTPAYSKVFDITVIIIEVMLILI